jgi:hypothetical protein
MTPVELKVERLVVVPPNNLPIGSVHTKGVETVTLVLSSGIFLSQTFKIGKPATVTFAHADNLATLQAFGALG